MKKQKICILSLFAAIFLLPIYFITIWNNAYKCENLKIKKRLTYDSLIVSHRNSKEENLMIQRSLNIDQVCEQMTNVMTQSCSLKNHYLQDPNTGTIYCFLHKVASTTWMSFFARLENDSEFLKRAQETGKYHKVLFSKNCMQVLN